MTTHPNLNTLLSRLGGVTRTAKGHRACCPVHGDAHPSLDIDPGDDGRILLKCMSQGCPLESILAAVGMTAAEIAPPGRPAAPPREPSFEDRIVCAYDYRDERGELLYQVVRLRDPKDFRQRRVSGARLNDRNQSEPTWAWKKHPRQVPYRLPELLAADPKAWVLVCEGEKSCDNLAALGLVATNSPGGAEKWNLLDAATIKAAFAGRKIAILPDRDGPGLRHAVQVAESLAGVAVEIRVLELPGLDLGGDVSDWLIREGAA